jgi:hypothetical protein
MINILKVNITHPEYKSGMKFQITLNGDARFFTEKAIIELRNKITSTLVLNGIEEKTK